MNDQKCGCARRCCDKNDSAPMCADDNTPVMAYVPVQCWGKVYAEPLALCRGTLFPALDKPFCGKGGCRCE